MWVLRAIIIALIVICVVAFAFYNVGATQRVSVDLILARYVDVPLITVVFWSFVSGVLVSLVMFVSTYIRISVDVRSARKRIQALEGEVAVLRNRPIEDSADLLKGADRADPEVESPFSGS